MNDTIITFGVAAVLLGVILLILWLKNKIFGGRTSKSEPGTFEKQFKERLLNPDFAAVEAKLGRSLPLELKKLYTDKEEILRGDFDVLIKPKNDSHGSWTIASYEPADENAVRDDWPKEGEYFTFANDGCGNFYLIDLRASRPEVLFADHEMDEFIRLGVLDEFLSAPRKS